jgi:hypothetical protein
MFTGRGKQLTVFLTESNYYHHQALYMVIIEMLSGVRAAAAQRPLGHRRLWRLIADSHVQYPSQRFRSSRVAGIAVGSWI